MSEDAQDDKVTVRDEGDGAGWFAWFLVGAAVGATAALLYAPKTGKDARRYITRKAQKSKVAIEDSTNDLVDTGKDLFDRGCKLVEDAAELFDRGRKLVRG